MTSQMHFNRSSSSCRRPSGLLLVVTVAVFLVLVGPVRYGAALAKRFDCELFCRTTGFHGNVGGCRCSFTLFTSKRNSINGGSSGGDDGAALQNLQDYALTLGRPASESNTVDELTRIPRDQQERYVRM